VLSNALFRTVIDLLVVVLYSRREIKIDDFQAEVLVDKMIVGFDIPMSDTVLVKIRDVSESEELQLKLSYCDGREKVLVFQSDVFVSVGGGHGRGTDETRRMMASNRLI